jgi:TetR/AcrR family transcriptional regulator of autoinduction and epiphytic fitness
VRSKRDMIIEAAIDTLGAHPDATLSDVATAAAVARRTIYGHFASRAELVRAIADQAAEDLETLMERLGPLTGKPPTDLAVLTFWTWPVANRYRLLLSLGRHELGDQTIVRLMSPAHQLTVEIVAAGQADGSFSDYLPAETIVALADNATIVILEEHNRGVVGDPAAAVSTATLMLAGVEAATATTAVDEARRILEIR